MKKSILIGTVLTAFLFSPVIPVQANETSSESDPTSFQLTTEVKSAILLERDTGEILFDENADKKLPPASMTKVMTLLLIMEALDTGMLELDEVVTVSERASSMGGSQVFLSAGEEMTVNDLLKGVAIASGNDASVALAERISGSEEEFVKKMNDKVKELGLENTHFENSSGLPADNHYSTSHDMAIIAKELLKYESITDYTSVYDDYLRKGKDNEFWLVNTNKLVKFYPGVDGLKTGFTNEAMYCLTATAKKNDMRVITVVMGAETAKERNATVSQLLDYAFNHFNTVKLYEKDEQITSLELLKAEDKDINIVTSESISTIHKKGDESPAITTTIKLEEDIQLPLKKGDQVGLLTVKDENKVILKSPLIIDANANQASYLTLIKKVAQNLVKSPTF
ncbi:MAG TPA: D-alanyl-D-alanine carboxypeptidase family protein [Virgibacillus sp.]|nr:D-alanyl-D-alanine carboxypeptidase family protein [Virgibacillus sp.]